jgi:hypothetical protein
MKGAVDAFAWTGQSRVCLRASPGPQCFLKYWTSRSCCFAFSKLENVPRLRRFPVDSSFLREYRRYSPDLSLRIIEEWMPIPGARAASAVIAQIDTSLVVEIHSEG